MWLILSFGLLVHVLSLCPCMHRDVPADTVLLLLDALPAPLQSPGEAPSAEVVHTHIRSGEEEDHQGYDHHGVGTATTLLQLPALERLEDYLQEVSHTSQKMFAEPALMTASWIRGLFSLVMSCLLSSGMQAYISVWL